MTDPTAITIPKGETEQVLRPEDVGPDMKYIVEVTDAPVRYAHRKPDASRGAELRPGQNHKLENFRGKGLFLNAPNAPAKVRVRRAGADLESQPTRDVTIESVELGSGIATESNQDEQISNQEQIIDVLTQIEENTQ